MTKADKEGQRKTPILRFKGFTDDWEQRKLGKVATFINGRAYKQNELLDSGKYKVLRVGNFYTNDSWYYSNLELADKYYIDKGDLVYTWSATFGPHIWDGEKVIYHYHIWKIELSKFLDRDFTLQILEADKAKLLANTNGSTMIHVTKKDMESKVISLPIIEEQKQIGLYLTKFDTLIALYDRKLKLLSQVKKYFLDNLFAKKEYPNLRFKGFTDAWEQRKLENLSEHKGGTSIEKYFSSDGLYKVISIGSYGLNNEYIDQGIRAVKNKTTESKLVRSGQLTMVLNDKTANGNLIGRCLLISKDNEFIVNQRTEIIIPGPDLNENYAYYYLNGPFRNKVKKIAQGGTQIYVNYSSVKRQKINYPIKNEQIKISKLLKIIKSLITLYENKQHHLTEIKKTLLNTMFI